MNNVSTKKIWLSGDIRARVEPPPIQLVKVDPE